MIDRELTKVLQGLSNAELFSTAKSAVQNETNSTLKVIYTLREIEKRRAFAEKCFPNLIEFCVEYLGYKRDAAYRRVAAMQALRDVPEIEEKVKDGSLGLTTLAQAQSHFSRKKREQKPLTKREKLEIFAELENKSVRQTENLFLTLAPKEIPNETLKPIDDETFEWRLALPKRVYEKLQKLKGNMGPEKASVDSIEALERAFDIANREYEKKFEKSKKVAEPRNIILKKNESEPINPTDDQKKVFWAPGKSSTIKNEEPIPINTKRAVWQRDQSQCAYEDETSGQRCSSKYRLEIDHIIPRAQGGSNDIENLRLACKAHNQLAAIKVFGSQTMNKYILMDQSREYKVKGETPAIDKYLFSDQTQDYYKLELDDSQKNLYHLKDQRQTQSKREYDVKGQHKFWATGYFTNSKAKKFNPQLSSACGN